ncbi:MAG: hypothetical protein ACLFTH_04780 [Candidatus Woesearchaeota archaeon]
MRNRSWLAKAVLFTGTAVTLLGSYSCQRINPPSQYADITSEIRLSEEPVDSVLRAYEGNAVSIEGTYVGQSYESRFLGDELSVRLAVGSDTIDVEARGIPGDYMRLKRGLSLDQSSVSTVQSWLAEKNSLDVTLSGIVDNNKFYMHRIKHNGLSFNLLKNEEFAEGNLVEYRTSKK